MAGICNTCKYFRTNIYPGKTKVHHCDFQSVALSEAESRQNCDECIPQDKKAKGCCH